MVMTDTNRSGSLRALEMASPMTCTGPAATMNSGSSAEERLISSFNASYAISGLSAAATNRVRPNPNSRPPVNALSLICS